MRAGLTYIPMAGIFGLVGFHWRRLPAAVQPFVGVVGLALCASGYLGVAIAMQGGSRGGAAMWAALTVTGIGLGLSASPLLTQSLLRVPPAHAGDASGVLTTTIQLGQLVAVFGTVFLSALAAAAGTSRAVLGRGPDDHLLLARGSGVGGHLSGVALARSLRLSRRSSAKAVGAGATNQVPVSSAAASRAQPQDRVIPLPPCP